MAVIYIALYAPRMRLCLMVLGMLSTAACAASRQTDDITSCKDISSTIASHKPTTRSDELGYSKAYLCARETADRLVHDSHEAADKRLTFRLSYPSQLGFGMDGEPAETTVRVLARDVLAADCMGPRGRYGPCSASGPAHRIRLRAPLRVQGSEEFNFVVAELRIARTSSKRWGAQEDESRGMYQSEAGGNSLTDPPNTDEGLYAFRHSYDHSSNLMDAMPGAVLCNWGSGILFAEIPDLGFVNIYRSNRSCSDGRDVNEATLSLMVGPNVLASADVTNIPRSSWLVVARAIRAYVAASTD